MAATQQQNHGALGAAFLDRSSNFHQSLPPEECTYSKTEVQIPMPDGIHLVADLYQPSDLPSGSKAHGLILVIGCYGRGELMSVIHATIFAARGYGVLFASCRGTFGSGGTFIPGMSEKDDSQAIVRWMREQPWYPGKFATFGVSYMGYTQWALLEDPPEDLIASVILCGPHDHARHNWYKGAYRMDRIAWTFSVAHQEDRDAGGAVAARLATAGKELKTVMEALPILPSVEKHFGGRAPYIRDFMTTPNIDDNFWAPVRHSSSLDRVKVPMLLGSGWYDTFTYESMEQYQRLKERNCKAYFTVGPWTHSEGCGLYSMPEVFDFFDEYVAGRKKDHRPLPVKVFVTGEEEWRQLPSWPPATEPHTLFLHGDKSISTQVPAKDSASISFTFDPAQPTPTIGGPLMQAGGRVDDSAYTSRSDLLVYTSPPLIEDIEVMGKPIVQLTHSTDIPFADLWVRLSEVDAEGVSHNIVEDYEALPEQREGETVAITLQDCAHLFKKGTQLRIIVAGGSFPLMARNLGCEGNRTLGKDMKAVTHTVKHQGGISSVILPCSTGTKAVVVE